MHVSNAKKIYKLVFLRYRQLKQQWEMKTEEGDLLQTKLQQSSYHKQQEELDALKKTIGEMPTVPNLCAALLSLILRRFKEFEHMWAFFCSTGSSVGLLELRV